MYWLWPEADSKSARCSLNSTICAVRKLLLGCERLPTSLVDYVVLEEGHYRLSTDLHLYSDKDEFDARYQHGRQLEKAQRMPEAIAEYSKAIQLYRGDFLVEDLYEEWTWIERQRLINAYIDILERLAAHYMTTGRYQESIEVCYQVLEKDPSQEVSHRLLMECYARLGLRSRALRQYELCEQILRRKYGLEPSPDTKTTYMNL